jgi:lipoprotein NlpI
MRWIPMTAALAVCLSATAQEPTPVDRLLALARAALARGDGKEALVLARKAVEAAPKDPRAFHVCGLAHAALRQHAEAAEQFGRAILLDPKDADAYDRRGGEFFKMGDFAASLRDFDKTIALRPDDFPGHWRRGITCYYARQFKEGVKQFDAYEKVDTNDVENAVWHYLCNVPLVGVDQARAAILKIGKDKRVPMMTVYELFCGRAKPDDVLKAAREGAPPKEQLSRRLFYAHLYLGLYHESLGDAKAALAHLEEAAQRRIDHYMGDVAVVHRDLLRKAPK